MPGLAPDREFDPGTDAESGIPLLLLGRLGVDGEDEAGSASQPQAQLGATVYGPTQARLRGGAPVPRKVTRIGSTRAWASRSPAGAARSSTIRKRVIEGTVRDREGIQEPSREREAK